jgi:hypothetical protein
MSTTKIIQPVNGHIVLRELEESDQMAGNIFLPEIVLVPKMGSQRVSIDMDEYIVCKSTDIIGIVK